jgi:hypothetical protein
MKLCRQHLLSKFAIILEWCSQSSQRFSARSYLGNYFPIIIDSEKLLQTLLESVEKLEFDALFLPLSPCSKMEIVYVYQKKRKEFGKQSLLSDRAAEIALSIAPDPSYIKNYVERNPTHTEAQCCPDKSEHEVIAYIT